MFRSETSEMLPKLEHAFQLFRTERRRIGRYPAVSRPDRHRQVRRGDETVVSAAYDDRVVILLHALFLGGSKKGSFTIFAAARLRRCSTVISNSTSVPSAMFSTCASAMYFLRMGDQQPDV